MLLASNSYFTVIAFSVIVILSYFFNLLAKKTQIPSVLMLIVLGILIKQGMTYLGLPEIDYFPTLEVLGIVGLIMIVLEAALDLKLTKEKTGLIVKSFSLALISLVVTSLACAFIINYFIIEDPMISLVYAIPVSILSSAIIIPSVVNLKEDKKEFMVYESTFSDILGILFFYFLIGTDEGASATTIATSVLGNIVLTITVAVAVSYGLILVFQNITTQVKLFLLIAILLMLYAIGKLSGLSSLIIILIFGLILNNHELFFQGPFKKWLKRDKINHMLEDFHVVCLESAFVVRTFFFVIFGITITLSTLLNWQVALTSLLLVASFYLIRYLFLRMIKGKDVLPELFIAPRGLITILLFFSIPDEMQVDNFDPGILMYTVIITSLIMTFGLIKWGTQRVVLPHGFKEEDMVETDAAEE